MSDEQIMQKYKLSTASLQSLFDKLVKAELMTEDALDERAARFDMMIDLGPDEVMIDLEPAEVVKAEMRAPGTPRNWIGNIIDRAKEYRRAAIVLAAGTWATFFLVKDSVSLQIDGYWPVYYWDYKWLASVAIIIYWGSLLYVIGHIVDKGWSRFKIAALSCLIAIFFGCLGWFVHAEAVWLRSTERMHRAELLVDNLEYDLKEGSKYVPEEQKEMNRRWLPGAKLRKEQLEAEEHRQLLKSRTASNQLSWWFWGIGGVFAVIGIGLGAWELFAWRRETVPLSEADFDSKRLIEIEREKARAFADSTFARTIGWVFGLFYIFLIGLLVVGVVGGVIYLVVGAIAGVVSLVF